MNKVSRSRLAAQVVLAACVLSLAALEHARAAIPDGTQGLGKSEGFNAGIPEGGVRGIEALIGFADSAALPAGLPIFSVDAVNLAAVHAALGAVASAPNSVLALHLAPPRLPIARSLRRDMPLAQHEGAALSRAADHALPGNVFEEAKKDGSRSAVNSRERLEQMAEAAGGIANTTQSDLAAGKRLVASGFESPYIRGVSARSAQYELFSDGTTRMILPHGRTLDDMARRPAGIQFQLSDAQRTKLHKWLDAPWGKRAPASISIRFKILSNGEIRLLAQHDRRLDKEPRENSDRAASEAVQGPVADDRYEFAVGEKISTIRLALAKLSSAHQEIVRLRLEGASFLYEYKDSAETAALIRFAHELHALTKTSSLRGTPTPMALGNEAAVGSASPDRYAEDKFPFYRSQNSEAAESLGPGEEKLLRKLLATLKYGLYDLSRNWRDNGPEAVSWAIKNVSLTERERQVLVLRFSENLSLEESGNVLGVTKARVGQLEKKLVLKIELKIKRWSSRPKAD